MSKPLNLRKNYGNNKKWLSFSLYIFPIRKELRINVRMCIYKDI